MFCIFLRKPPDSLCFVKQAEKILQIRDDLRREILERKEGLRGELKIGSTAITGGHILPPLLRIYKEQYPNVCIQLIEESTEKLIDLTAKGLVDISILSLPFEDSHLNTTTMLTEPLYLVLPKEPQQWMPEKIKQRMSSTKLIKQNALPIEDFANCPFILLKQGYGFRRTVLELCARGKFEPQIAYETSSIETAQSLVGHGLGLTVVPGMIVHRSAYLTSLAYMKLDSNPTRTLVFTYNKKRYLSMNAKALIEIYEKQS
ncbi:LysR family transcriptional regulator substrate-binding protein [Peribacillus loiseleuriae]|uniref:LysR family transcriptional regulator substrate-binding protein n=1 Tax=Peribacillus loiseleuriae TaxID=1679170 RepID=UPI003D06F6FB